MARVVYTKRNELKLFGIKLFEFNTNYNERSSDKELSEDDFYINLQEVINENRN